MMTLSEDAGKFVLCCIAIVLFWEVASIVARVAWDLWTDWKWERRRGKL